MRPLVVSINSRDALPVRAIAYVTGWNLSPDEVAKNLAHRAAEPFAVLRDVAAYHIYGGNVIQVLPKEWDAVVAKIAGLEAMLRESYPDHDRGYAEWQKQVVHELPAGTFVWLDEFEQSIARDFSPYRVTYIDERPGDRDLNYHPIAARDVRDVILEGFENPERLSMNDDSIGKLRLVDRSDFRGSFIETLCNDTVIDWGYWAHKMPVLSVGQAARLMSGLDPDIYESLSARPNKNDPSQYCARARNIQRLAETQGVDRLTPIAWVEWAEQNEMPVHPSFRNEAERRRDHELGAAVRIEAATPAASDARSTENESERHDNRKNQSLTVRRIGSGRDLLDLAIDAAVSQAGTDEVVAVFACLKELALNDKAPFTGEVVGSTLMYTASNNTLQAFSKDALRKRLARRSAKNPAK